MHHSTCPVTGGVWCLDFQHAVYGSSSGRLNVYTVVNGVKGSLLYTKIGSSSTSKIWERKLVLVDGTSLSGDDMVEVSLVLFLKKKNTSQYKKTADTYGMNPDQK